MFMCVHVASAYVCAVMKRVRRSVPTSTHVQYTRVRTHILYNVLNIYIYAHKDRKKEIKKEKKRKKQRKKEKKERKTDRQKERKQAKKERKKERKIDR